MLNKEVELEEVLVDEIEELEEIVTPGCGFGCDCK